MAVQATRSRLGLLRSIWRLDMLNLQGLLPGDALKSETSISIRILRRKDMLPGCPLAARKPLRRMARGQWHTCTCRSGVSRSHWNGSARGSSADPCIAAKPAPN